MKINSDFLELLRLNDSDKLKKFILENGKGPHPTCPISFADINLFNSNQAEEGEESNGK